MTIRHRSPRLKWNRSATSRKSEGIALRARDHVEQNVPLCAEQHQQNRTNAKSAAQLDDGKQQNWKQRRGGNRSRDLREGLQEAGETRVETDGDAGRDCPCRGNQQGNIHAQERRPGARIRTP